MSDPESRVVRILESFGFDEFAAKQIFERLKSAELIQTEPLGDSYSQVYEALSDLGWEQSEVHEAIKAMLDAGVVFRER